MKLFTFLSLNKDKDNSLNSEIFFFEALPLSIVRNFLHGKKKLYYKKFEKWFSLGENIKSKKPIWRIEFPLIENIEEKENLRESTKNYINLYLNAFNMGYLSDFLDSEDEKIKIYLFKNLLKDFKSRFKIDDSYFSYKNLAFKDGAILLKKFKYSFYNTEKKDELESSFITREYTFISLEKIFNLLISDLKAKIKAIEEGKETEDSFDKDILDLKTDIKSLERYIKEYAPIRKHLSELNDLYLNPKEELKIVISRHPYDILGQSTNRRWTSCKDLFKERNTLDTKNPLCYLKYEIFLTLIAYLTTKNDKNLNNPLARILIIPFKVNDFNINFLSDEELEKFKKIQSKYTPFFYDLAPQVYGELSEKTKKLFMEKVKKWVYLKQKDFVEEMAKEFKNKKFFFDLHSNVYNDFTFSQGPASFNFSFNEKLKEINSILKKSENTLNISFFEGENGEKLKKILPSADFKIQNNKLIWLRGVFDGEKILKKIIKKIKNNNNSKIIWSNLGIFKKGIFKNAIFQKDTFESGSAFNAEFINANIIKMRYAKETIFKNCDIEKIENLFSSEIKNCKKIQGIKFARANQFSNTNLENCTFSYYNHISDTNLIQNSKFLDGGDLEDIKTINSCILYNTDKSLKIKNFSVISKCIFKNKNKFDVLKEASFFSGGAIISDGEKINNSFFKGFFIKEILSTIYNCTFIESVLKNCLILNSSIKKSFIENCTLKGKNSSKNLIIDSYLKEIFVENYSILKPKSIESIEVKNCKIVFDFNSLEEIKNGFFENSEIFFPKEKDYKTLYSKFLSLSKGKTLSLIRLSFSKCNIFDPNLNDLYQKMLNFKDTYYSNLEKFDKKEIPNILKKFIDNDLIIEKKSTNYLYFSLREKKTNLSISLSKNLKEYLEELIELENFFNS